MSHIVKRSQTCRKPGDLAPWQTPGSLAKSLFRWDGSWRRSLQLPSHLKRRSARLRADKSEDIPSGHRVPSILDKCAILFMFINLADTPKIFQKGGKEDAIGQTADWSLSRHQFDWQRRHG